MDTSEETDNDECGHVIFAVSIYFRLNNTIMRLFERNYRATAEQKEKGRAVALLHDLPRVLRDLSAGTHSYERRFTISRTMGYKTVYDSIDVYKMMTMDKEKLEKKCRELGIVPVFQGDYISLESFPRRNIIQEEVVCKGFRDGMKTVEKRAFFDILDYLLQ